MENLRCVEIEALQSQHTKSPFEPSEQRSWLPSPEGYSLDRRLGNRTPPRSVCHDIVPGSLSGLDPRLKAHPRIQIRTPLRLMDS